MLDYRYGIDEMQHQFSNIEKSYLGSLSGAIWNFDTNLINAQIDGIVQLPYVVQVHLDTSYGQVFRAEKDQYGPAEYPMSASFPVSYKNRKNENEILGQLSIVADKKALYDKLLNSVFYIVSSHALKTFVVSAFILLIIYFLIIRRLEVLTEYARRVSNTRTFVKSDFALPSPPTNDELGELMRTISSMSTYLYQQICLLNKKEDELIVQASIDDLTGIQNRKSCNSLLEYLVTDSNRNNSMLAVAYLDIDDFKAINDTLGHPIGDKLLIVVSKIIRSLIRENDVFGRMGGDEFLMILPNVKTDGGVVTFLDKLFDRFSTPLVIEGKKLNINFSLGLSIYPRDSREPGELIKNADIALYQAKKNGKNCYSFFEPRMNKALVERHQLQARVEKAISNREFILHYQPIVRGVDGDLACLEALVRWECPEQGMIMPDNFIPMAEESGQIIEIGEIVMDEALRQVKQWQEKYNWPLGVAINISSIQLNSNGFTESLIRLLEKYQFDPKCLELEITERFLLEDNQKMINSLKYYRDMGIQLSLDDFGTGYSALSYLKKYPFTSLKLDRSFVAELPANAENRAISAAVLNISHNLKMKVVAEGVENLAQYDYLVQQNADLLQGYYISYPLPPEQFEQWYEQRTSKQILASS
ncbi:MAG: EAL domain-containing protein [Gammaproteobacteria bacterium]|nr:EAL domain-containing protein [Gammaproteobacteria bacterium]